MAWYIDTQKEGVRIQMVLYYLNKLHMMSEKTQ